MSDFILEYEVLEAIAKNSKSLGKRANEYSENLQIKLISGIGQVTGAPSAYLTNASDMVRDKIYFLKQKSDAFYSFAEQVTNLLTVAEQIDQEVADAIAASREYFLDHHQSLRIEDWKVNLLDFLVDIKNSIPFLNLLADIFKGLEAVFESLKDAVKHWYECGGGKYIGEIVASIGLVALAVVGMVGAVAALTVTGVGFFAVCGIIGATIALVNSVTNVATSFRAVDAALDGNPAMAVIYGKQDKLSDVIRQTNFGDGTLNTLSNLGAGALDVTETFCDIVGIAEIAGIAKLFKGDIFKKLKSGTLSFSDLKNRAKNGIVDLKTNIKNGYADFKSGSKLDDIGDVHKTDADLNVNKNLDVGAEGLSFRQTGGRNLDNLSAKELMALDDEAAELYEIFKNSTDDIANISKQTGIPEWKVEKIKNHVFNNDHILRDRIGQFDPDIEIADAWKRLQEGNYTQNDLDLLNHEYYEYRFEKFFGTDYSTAHSRTVETGRTWDPYKEEN